MQENFGQNEFQGVVVPPETIADSNAKKAKRVRTLAELPVSRDAVSLLGSVIKPHRTHLSNKTLARMTERVHGFNGRIADGDIGILDCARIEQVMNSYLGFCRPHRTYRIRRGLLETFGPEFYRYFYIRNHHDSIRTKVKYRPIQTPPEFALAA